MNKSLLISSLLMLAFTAQAADSKIGSVKKSASGICHESQSRFYAKLKHFTSYETLKACLDSGGQLAGRKLQK
jgi:hypothetical protein